MSVRVSKDCRKYGAPLYACGWVNDKIIFAAGGGGKTATGVPNRAFIATFDKGTLSEADCAEKVQSDCPVAVALHPTGTRAVLALGSGGCAYFAINKKEKKLFQILEGLDNLSEKHVGRVQRLSFSEDGAILALGTSDGAVLVHEGAAPFSRRCMVKEATKGEVKDVDVLAADYGIYVAATGEDGKCKIFDGKAATLIQELEPPKAIQGSKVSFSRIRFVPGGGGSLVALIVANTPRGRVAHVAVYGCSRSVGEGPEGRSPAVLATSAECRWVLRRQERAHLEPAAALAVSPCGKYIGTGTVEGSVGVFALDTLRPIKRVKAAHMIAVTGIAFASDSSAVLTVSPDSSARCTPVRPPSSFPLTALLLTLLLLLALAAALFLGSKGSGPLAPVISQVLQENPQLAETIARLWSGAGGAEADSDRTLL